MKKIMLICFIILSLIIAAGCGDKKDNATNQETTRQNASTERKKTPKDQVSKEEMDLFIPIAKQLRYDEQQLKDYIKTLKMDYGIDFSHLKRIKNCNRSEIEVELCDTTDEKIIGDTLRINSDHRIEVTYSNERNTEMYGKSYYIFKEKDNKIGRFQDVVVANTVVEKAKKEMDAFVKNQKGSCKKTDAGLVLVKLENPIPEQQYFPVLLVSQTYEAASKVYGEQKTTKASLMIFDVKGNLLGHFNDKEVLQIASDIGLGSPIPISPDGDPMFLSKVIQIENESTDKLKKYIALKDLYNNEITSLSKDINSYLNSHSDFKQDRSFLQRAKNIKTQIKRTGMGLRVADIADSTVKKLLGEVLYAEMQRVDGLITGITESQSGGDYRYGFKSGNDAYSSYEQANTALNNRIR